MSTSSKQLTNNEFDANYFRKALSQFATGITVITTRLEDGSLVGMTASSFNSVSLSPPLVLWSLACKSASMQAFLNASHYVINVLSVHQAGLAEQFARKDIDRFTNVDFSLSDNGHPVLAGSSAWFECKNRSRYPEGDHVIFVGEVVQCVVEPQAALVYHGSAFATTAKITDAIN
jgi:flavin reductase (DIM6/NTAB) family NADH-FMN oxidoreductase RutF